MKKILVLGAISLNESQQARLATHGELKFQPQLPSNRAALLELLAEVNIALLYEVSLEVGHCPLPPSVEVVGVDLGLTTFTTFSNSETNPSESIFRFGR